ncbi:hypothetical protein RchiOBHm_Chr2g0111131 [Rosa chinensis]|uniref:Uncharacterized protein n=1 Tax=Rosa chinensis TaxID=74649 RepID=A0A2P6RPY7_ROSCH|nr:hypothetical protein RchiOBHm_Chr2g0111131 [Rosa chinensis]
MHRTCFFQFIARQQCSRLASTNGWPKPNVQFNVVNGFNFAPRTKAAIF